ncbi:MAG: hypothetical protein HPY61_04810 [Methanotrichaceae archaeon]|nr:hypothetical protein [Methanotrichaceae archaeon]
MPGAKMKAMASNFLRLGEGSESFDLSWQADQCLEKIFDGRGKPSPTRQPKIADLSPTTSLP